MKKTTNLKDYVSLDNWIRPGKIKYTLTMSYTTIIIVYYPPEVRRGKYWGLGVFLLQCFPLVKI